MEVIRKSTISLLSERIRACEVMEVAETSVRGAPRFRQGQEAPSPLMDGREGRPGWRDGCRATDHGPGVAALVSGATRGTTDYQNLIAAL